MVLTKSNENLDKILIRNSTDLSELVKSTCELHGQLFANSDSKFLLNLERYQYKKTQISFIITV